VITIEEMLPHCKNVNEKFVVSLVWFSRAVMVFSIGHLSWVFVDGIVPIEFIFFGTGPFFLLKYL
jgi:hypothetical protein